MSKYDIPNGCVLMDDIGVPYELIIDKDDEDDGHYIFITIDGSEALKLGPMAAKELSRTLNALAEKARGM